MKRLVNTYALYYISVIFFFISCTKEVGKLPVAQQPKAINSCDTVVYTYNANIKNIIINNCAGCHFSGSPDGMLTDYLHLQAYALNGSIMGSLKGQGYVLMPPTGKLSDCEVKGIERWILAGANNN